MSYFAREKENLHRFLCLLQKIYSLRGTVCANLVVFENARIKTQYIQI